ncbi:hypothetical protein B0H16DRAFT_1477039 [Mycena metata]|uniref:Novel STAND NTPase 1 domain-containing protein n=1 Tax=Mycena metata TaxID=1033252 RepID=A0AAD7HAY9_9AGAR|nr:hypothetical protein B0H16DRAFT_1477039 [Mycena metata]
MPRQPTVNRVHLNNISKCVATTANTLDVLVDTLNISGLEAISNTTQSLLELVQAVKQNKDECAELMGQTHELLKAIIRGELSVLLKDCKTGLQQGFDFFQIKTVDIMSNVKEMQDQAQLKHQEVLDILEAMSSSDSASSVCGHILQEYQLTAGQISKMYSGSFASSNSISMLPAEPKIFHGRDSELADILKLFSQGTPRIAILGAGGMGKTCLARIVLHHEEITTKYHGNRSFVTCDTASSKLQLAGLIGAHLGLKPGKDLTQAVLQHLSSSPPTLLILDNLETVWESTKSRKEVEELLSLLTEISSLALLITMRGAERPSKVQWTRPFLPPLSPLAHDAARKMFMDIADDKHSLEEVDQVLSLTDNMPLSISLLAHLVDVEGCNQILSRWQTEKTSLISKGYDRRSNLELSISLSLSSPRITSMPQSQDLLALLSMLPDGLSDIELNQTKFPINDILGCKATLLRTTLAYNEDHKRLRVLAPIREYMGRLFPPTDQMIQPLLKHFHELLESYIATVGTKFGMLPIDRIASNYTNIQNILHNGLRQEYPNVVDVIYCACRFNHFSWRIGRGATTLLEDISNLLPSLGDHQLKGYIITQLFTSWRNHPTSHPDSLIVEALNHFKYFDDADLQGYYYIQHNSIPTALQHIQSALSIAQADRNLRRQCDALNTLGQLEIHAGDHAAGRAHAHEVQRLAKLSGDLWREARALYNEAICLASLGEYPECIAQSSRGRAILGLCGLSHGDLDYSLMAIQAEVHKFKSEYVKAHNIQNQLQDTANATYQHAYGLMNIAEIEVLMGVSKTEIQKKIETSQVIFRASKNTMLTIACDATQADLNLREGDMSSTLFCKCLQLGKYSEVVSYCLERLADIRRWEGSRHPTFWPAVFLAHSLKAKERLGIYKALQFLGDVFLRENDEATSISLFTLALEGFTQMDVHRSRAECMIQLGDISNKHGALLRALEFWETARPLFECSSQAKRVQHIDTRLAGIGGDVKEQYKQNLARVTELNTPTRMVEEVDVDLFEDKLKKEEVGLVAV